MMSGFTFGTLPNVEFRSLMRAVAYGAITTGCNEDGVKQASSYHSLPVLERLVERGLLRRTFKYRYAPLVTR